MFARFVEWTTQLNQTDHLGFALVTVLTMAGVGVAVVAELLLGRLGIGKATASPGRGPASR